MPILLNARGSRRGWSRIGKFMRCPQSFAHARFNITGQRSTGTKATNKGALIGLGIGHWYARMGAWQGSVAIARELITDTVLGEAAAGSVRDSSLPGAVIVADPALILEPAAAMAAECEARPELLQWLDLSCLAVQRYTEHYAREYDTLRVLAVEAEHAIDLGLLDCPGHHEHGKLLFFTSRCDLVFADAAGRVTIPDTKTSGTVTSAAAKYYGRHGQFFGMELVGRAVYGDRFDGARLNMVQTDGEKFARPTLPPRPWAIGQFRDRLIRAEHVIAALEIRTREYWEERDAIVPPSADLTSHTWPAADHELTCYSRYGLCEFANMCDWGPASAFR